MAGIRWGRLLGGFIVALPCAGVLSAQDAPWSNRLTTTREVPNAFGTDSYTVTTVPAVAFYPSSNSYGYFTSASFGRYQHPDVVNDMYAGLDLPAGAVIDFIGLNSTTSSVPSILSAEIVRRDKFGNAFVIGVIDSTPHPWDTDINVVPIGYTWTGYSGYETLILHVQWGADPNPQFLGWVEVWWRRSVSPAPEVATFNDVPVNHNFFQFIEALAASGITGGCGGGNFCPDSPLTRGQMAVFLAKALGLHWSN
jgi:S-layer homology domain